MSAGLVPGLAAGADPHFPEPAKLRSAVDFWMRVYLEVSTSGGLLHDARHLGVVYETLRFDEDDRLASRQRRIDARKRHHRAVLQRLARNPRTTNKAEQAILQMFELDLGHPPTRKDLLQAAERVRFQLGQRDKFRDGLIRSGAYENEIRAIFRDMGLPEDLAYLPHVESSFNPSAYSKYGAAGMWQFMRSTGRLYMKVDYVVDERLDPIASSHAAARLLRDNYAALQSWPLALTAYNHGAGGMKRAKQTLGTSNIDAIVFRYQSRSFGFASRNFYAQFLAARKIAKSHEAYFGPLRRNEPHVVDTVALPFYADVRDLQQHLGVSLGVIQELNPALRPPVFRSSKRIPKGYTLRLPAGTIAGEPSRWIASLPQSSRHSDQHHSNYYQVRRGDTLSQIARKTGTTVSQLVAMNELSSHHRIYAGQVLQLPERGGSSAPARSGLVRTANAAPRTPPPAPQAPKAAQPAAPAAKERPPVAARSSESMRISPAAPSVAPLGEDSPWRRIDGEWVIVDSSETIGHLADWLQVSPSHLRRLNKLSSKRQLRLGQRLRLDFSRVTPSEFLERRLEHHKGIEEDFFRFYQVSGTVDHTLRRGETLWTISRKTYAVPMWLIHRYNPEVDLARFVPGTTLKIPVVAKK